MFISPFSFPNLSFSQLRFSPPHPPELAGLTWINLDSPDTTLSHERARAASGEGRLPPPAGARLILYVDHTAELGGAEVALLRLLEALDRSRFTPVVLLFSEGPLADRLRKMNVEVVVFALEADMVGASRNQLGSALLRPRKLIGMLAHLWRVARFLRARPFDLVHTTSLKADLIGGVAARLAFRPLLWHIHDRIADDYMPAKVVKVFRTLARRMPRFVVVNSEATKRTLLPFPESRISVVHPGVPEELLAAAAEDSNAAPEIPIVGIVGRISPTKGQDIFLRAAALVAQRFPAAQFQIIGAPLFNHGSYELEVRKLADQLGLANVEFTGFCHDVNERIRNLTVLVHASPTPEPFGQVVVEAMAAGKAVVATDAGGIPEIVIDGDCGYLAPAGDHVAMAEKICTLLQDPARANAMGKRGRARVQAHFTAAQMARKTESVYETILGMKAAGKTRGPMMAVASRR